MVLPIYDKLSEEYEGKFKFCKINVDENRSVAVKYQIMSIPMQMFFNDGEKINEILGALPEPAIRTMVEDILEKFPSDEVGKLKVLLTSWVEHNKKHGEKLNRWVEKANNLEGNPIYKSALQAAQEVEKAAKQLSQVLIQLPKY